MADKQSEWIEPAGALRMLVRAAAAGCPTLADKVMGLFDLLHLKGIGQDCGATAAQIEAAKGAEPALRANVKNGTIKTRGYLNGTLVSIDEAEFADGQFDVWGRTLAINGTGAKRVFYRVRVCRKDVETVAFALALKDSDALSAVVLKKGNPGTKGKNALAQMQADLTYGNITREQLKKMKQKEVAARYGVARSTAVELRKKLLTESADN